MKTWYVYAHIAPDTEELFYIGVGTGNRAWSLGKSHRNPIHVNIHNKHGCRVEILADGFHFRENAVRTEVKLQKLYKPRACVQYGDGHSQEKLQSTRDKLSRAGLKRNEEARERLDLKSIAYYESVGQVRPYRRKSGKSTIFKLMKTCAKCLTPKEETEFSPHEDFHDGLDSACRACRSKARTVFTPLMQETYRKEHYPYNKKECTKCNDELELKAFSKRKRHKDGLSYVCRPCAKDINVPYVPEKKEKTEVIKKRVLFSF